MVIDHIYTRIMLEFCKVIGAKTLEQESIDQNGHLFCSIVKIKPCYELSTTPERAILKCEKFEGSDLNVELHITTKRITGDTLRSNLHQGGEFESSRNLGRKMGTLWFFIPLVIGFPYIADSATGELLWIRFNDYYGVHLEDFEEFSEVKKSPLHESFKEMRNIKENYLQGMSWEILSESAPKDWGDESSDFFTSHLHVGGKRLCAAFLLKGPAKFSPMTLSHLGKDSDQIVRLAKDPADVLVVQHCHDILPPVLET